MKICVKNMILSALFFVAGTASLFAAKPPKWLSDAKAVYPDEKYLARVGHGIEESAAKAAALGELAGYFTSQVSSVTSASSKVSESNGQASKERSVQQEIEVKSEMNLVAVDYSESYFDKKRGEYYVCAFIDRDVAWGVIEPEVNKARNKYEALYDQAQITKEKILKYKYLYKSRSAGDELIARLAFGFMINPSKKAEFQEMIDEIANDAAFGVLDEKSMPLLLEVTGDQGGIISSAVNSVFSEFGFVVSTAKSASQEYKLVVKVASNEEWSGDGDTKMVAIYPTLEMKLMDKNGSETFYSWMKRFGRVTNFSIEKAQQRAYNKEIAPEIKKSVPPDYRKHLMAD